MKHVLTFAILIVALAFLKAVVIALAITLALALLYSFARRPRETLSLLGVVIVTELASAQPVAFIVAVGIFCVTALIFGKWRRGAADSPPQGQASLALIELEN